MKKQIIYMATLFLIISSSLLNAQTLTEVKRLNLDSAATAVTWDGTSFWITTDTDAQEIDPTTGSVINSFALPGSMDGIDFNFTDSLLYFSDASTDDFYSYTRSGNLVLEMVQPTVDSRGLNPRDIEFINDEFWALDSRNKIGNVFRHDLPSLARIDSFAITTDKGAKGLGFDGVSAWVSYGTTNEIEQFNWTTKTSELLIDGTTLGLVEPRGINWDGNLLWIADYSAGALVAFSVDGVTGVEDEKVSPTSYSLEQNYPNPFNPTTTINFSVPKSSDVTLKIYNLLGKEVGTLINNKLDAGNHSIHFDASELSSSVYFYTLNSNSFRSTKKMILIK